MWQHLASILIGIQKEESFHMYIGKGRNGKSKLMDLLKMCLGDYKSDIPISLVTEKRTKLGGCAPEIQSLKGIRYAVISEPSKGDRINDGALKQLTGGDVIEGRGLYEKKSTKFKPQFKMGVCTNNLMDIKTQDNGTWRRIRLIHFMSFFTENPVTDDPDSPYQFKVNNDINTKFERWKEIFMSMLVDIAFQTKGQVFVPECVKAASNAYRESQDYIAEFIRDKIIVDKTGRIKKTELNSEFSIWYMSTYGRGGPPPKEVHAYMDKTYGKAKANVGWSGVKIRYERDDIDTMYQDEPDDIRPNDL
jgi:P4 family phage/plasmid primase-like protien